MSAIHRLGRPAAALTLSLGLALGAAGLGFAASGKGPDSVADTVDKVVDAVVNISTSQTIDPGKAMQMPQVPPGSPFEEFFEEFFKRRGEGNTPRRVSSLGSGFVIDASGIVVTNNHVIADADEIYANFTDGSKLKAEIIGRDTKTDIAVLRVKPDKPLKAVKFGDSEKLRVGDWVMAIGNPFGLGGSVTVGVVSARNRDINSGPYDSYIQTDAAINRGNSGGPLFNMEGDVIGINTAIISPSGGSIGIGFAIPAKNVSAIVDQLRQFGETRRGWIGVRIQGIDDQIAESLGLGRARGALIAGVNDNGPAAKGGVLPGDVIVKFDGRDVKDVRDLPRIVADAAVGKTVDVVVVRKGKEETLKVTLGRLEDSEKPQPASVKSSAPEEKSQVRRLLGLGLSTITEDLRKRHKIKEGTKGVVVTAIDRDSPAAERGLTAGDVIVEVSQEAVLSPNDVQKRIDALKKEGKKVALLLVVRGDGEQRFVSVAIP